MKYLLQRFSRRLALALGLLAIGGVWLFAAPRLSRQTPLARPVGLWQQNRIAVDAKLHTELDGKSLSRAVFDTRLTAHPTASRQPADVETLPGQENLPDLLTDATGNRITSPAQWAVRRSDIKEMIQYYEYGHLPPRPDRVIGERKRVSDFHASLGVKEEITLKIGSQHQMSMHICLHRPTSRTPFPVVISEVHAISDLPCLPMFLEHGYALVQYQREDLAPDLPDMVGPAQAAYPDHDWATLAVWAWGAMRVVDYLETRGDVDLNRIAITGHSRGGKAALLAGALDERFALVAPNGSGCGGAGCFRGTTRDNESLAQITDPQRFGYWFHARLRQFADRVDRLPFDQHFVKALVAPRALLCTEARGDLWANPIGTRRTSVAARQVYSLFEAEQKNGLHFRDGQHDQTLADWQTLLKFAQWHFFGERPADPDEFWQSP